MSVSESARNARVAPHELLPRRPGTRSGAVLRSTDNGRRRGAELLRMGYPIQLAREDRAGGGDVSEARGRGLRPYRAQHRRTAVPRGVKSRIPRSTRQSLVGSYCAVVCGMLRGWRRRSVASVQLYSLSPRVFYLSPTVTSAPETQTSATSCSGRHCTFPHYKSPLPDTPMAITPSRCALALLLTTPASAQTAHTVSPHVGQVCHLNYHHKHYSSVEPGLAGGACAQYQDNSCCNADKIHANSSYTNASFLLNIYGEKYAHDRCGPISAQCEALLVEENCGYECDVNWGRYRHKAVACGEAGTNHYEWQVSGLPIEVSTAFLSCYHSMQYCLPGCKRCPCYPLESNRTHQSWGCPSGLRQPSLVEPFEPDPDHSGGGKLVLCGRRVPPTQVYPPHSAPLLVLTSQQMLQASPTHMQPRQFAHLS